MSQLSPHGLRRAYATRLCAETKDLLLVQRALDHRFVGTTMKYAGVSDESVGQAMGAIG